MLTITFLLVVVAVVLAGYALYTAGTPKPASTIAIFLLALAFLLWLAGGWPWHGFR